RVFGAVAFAPGSSPATRPTNAAANIWYGIHGPTPPVSSAEANSPVLPRMKPNAGPKTLPAKMIRKKTVSTPAAPAPNGRTAATTADSTPSIATARASMPPSESCTSTTAVTSGSSIANSQGPEVVSVSAPPGATSSGQDVATRPKRAASATASAPRRRRRVRGLSEAVMGLAQRGGDLVHGQPPREDLLHLRREHRRGRDDLPRRAVRHDLAVGEDHDAAGELGHELDVVRRHDHAVARLGQPAGPRGERRLARVVEPPRRP